MVNESLLHLIYDAAHMQRWNDHIRPNGFTELDKQSHKMIIAYILAKYEESDKGVEINWRSLIEGGIFEYLQRIVLTDIKPHVYYKLMNERGDELNRWVIDTKLRKNIENIKDGFLDKLETYFFDDKYNSIEKKILRAAHYLATNWEFDIIYNLNSNMYGVEETKIEIESKLEEHYNLAGVQKIGLIKKTKNFIDFVGQLRFQKRWAQTPRVPETSVMGHMLVVAMLSYFFTLELGACDKRICNNYFAGLFHDLPEVLTRDIVSPVKSSIEGLGDIIKEIENRQVEEKILPLLPPTWHNEIKYFLTNEFGNKVIIDKKVKTVTVEDIQEKYNENIFSPIDGTLIKACDNLAAYIEASLSISHGITSCHLENAREDIYNRCGSIKILNIEFGPYYDFFKAHNHRN